MKTVTHKSVQEFITLDDVVYKFSSVCNGLLLYENSDGEPLYVDIPQVEEPNFEEEAEKYREPQIAMKEVISTVKPHYAINSWFTKDCPQLLNPPYAGMNVKLWRQALDMMEPRKGRVTPAQILKHYKNLKYGKRNLQ